MTKTKTLEQKFIYIFFIIVPVVSSQIVTIYFELITVFVV